jgi:predicted O-linked N-acetylglucosamine transferase (SPINDLY family)
MNLTTDSLQGHAGWRWSLPQGDSVFVSQQGAQVLSWQTGGQERLYLSPVSACDGTTAIRGGIPVCFPQFNQRGTLPKHGFARNMAWRLVSEQSHGSEKVFELSNNAQTHALWPIQFKTQLKVLLSAQSLKIQLSVQNLGLQTLSFTGALHTYFAVNLIEKVSLLGQAHHQMMLNCDWTDYEQNISDIFHLIGEGRKGAEPFGFQGISSSEELLKKCAEIYSNDKFPASGNLYKFPQYKHHKIRIGYLCGEFRNQATSILMTRVWELHDKSKFEIFGFDNGWDDGSDYRERIEKAFSYIFDISIYFP